MSQTSSHEVTKLLVAWKEGDSAALERLIPLVYSELRRMAQRYMRGERAGVSLQATALVNEAYLKLIEARHVSWENRAHFFAIAARLMRRVLVDMARRRNFQKRGGGELRVTLSEGIGVTPAPAPDLLALDEALSALAQFDERKCRVVEMRFFGGLTENEIAAALSVSEETVRRDWRLAKAWLLRRLTEGKLAGGQGFEPR